MSLKHSDTRTSLSPVRLGITFLLLAAALVLMPAMAVRADDYTVTNTDANGPGSLRQAILDANSNPGPDAISFSPGVSGTIVLTAALPAIGDDLTITGPGAENLAISGDNAHRVISITASTAVTITNVTVRDGNPTDGNGGGIYSAGDLFLGNMYIISNTISTSYSDGGSGIYIAQGTATLSSTHISDNNTGFSFGGGGVYVDGPTTTLEIRGGEISHNHASIGGGVCVYEGTATLSNTRVLSNSASLDGGGAFVYNQGTLNVNGGEISHNHANINGGGIHHFDQGVLNINDVEINHNFADGDGGGMYVYGRATLNISGGEISHNYADEYGGGAYIYGMATLTNTRVLSNSANDSGGGLYVTEGTLNVSGGEVSGNHARIQGGGMYLSVSTTTLSGTYILNNSSGWNGGGVQVEFGRATLSGTRILGNSAGWSGGGVYFAPYAIITATNGCVVNNSDVAIDMDLFPDPISGTLVATDNWWGAPSGPGGAGPGGGDSVSVDVEFVPFKTTPPPGCPNRAADLRMVKTVIPGTASPGQSITYTLAFSNIGGEIATGVLISDSVPISVSNTSVVSAGVSITQTGSAPNYVWRVADLAPSAGGVITITGVLGTPLAAGSFTNTAHIAIVAGEAITVNNSNAMSITVQNVAPVADDDNFGVTEDSSDNTLDVLDGDSDANDDILTISAVGTPDSGGTAVNGGTIITYTPLADFDGDEVFTYTVGDGNGGYDTATVTVTVSNVNDAPVATDNIYVTPEDTPVSGNVLTDDTGDGVDSDVDGDTLTAALDDDVAMGTLDLAGDGSFIYTPTLGYNGVVTFSYHARDIVSDSNVALVTITVSADVPTANDDGYSTDEDVTLSMPAPGVLVNDTDPNSDTLTATLVSAPMSGTLALNADGSFSYTPTLNYNGDDSFTYRVTDGTYNSNPATVAITVTAVNDEPVADDDTFSVGEDSIDNPLDVLDGDTDAEGDTLTIAVVSTPDSGGIAVNGGTVITYTPLADLTGVETFTYVIGDGNGGFDVATVTVTVNAVNDAPVADDDTFTVDEESIGNPLDVLDGDTDVDGDTLTISAIGTPNSGGTAINGNTVVTYTPQAGFAGDEVFTYTVGDGNGSYDTATVTVTVSNVNDPPVADAGDNQGVSTGETVTLDGSGSYDPDGHMPLTYSWAQVGGPGVTFTPNISITTFTAPSSAAVLTFTLVVTDTPVGTLGLPSVPDTVVISVTESGFYLYLPLVVRD